MLRGTHPVVARDHRMKAYFDNCIESGRVRIDLQPPSEMAAVEALLKAEAEGKVEIVTSRETWREQDKAANPAVRAQLAQARGEIPVVSNDHKLVGIHNQMDHLGTVSATPIISDIIDDALFKSLMAAGLKDADARHLMYAARNGCDRLVTTDPDFTSRLPQLESLCQGLKIATPSELAAVLSMPSQPEVHE
jgi:predicted nucleic acid-binding protein